jgi:taurine dioxygenase
MDGTANIAGISLKPLTQFVGAEVSGIDLSAPLTQDVVELLNTAFNNNVALVFRGQDLTEAHQLAFAENFGPLGLRRRAPKQIKGGMAATAASTMLVTNIPEEAGKDAGSYGDGEMWFHGDSCYYEVPNRATFLYSVELPSTGGNTKVNSMYAAYDNLPAKLKEKLEGRRVLQVHDHKRRERLNLDTIDLDELRHFWQPIFVTHPKTGRRSLYVNRLMSAAIEGLERAESDDILDRLFEIVEDPAIVYEHVWQPGDLLMWDNICSVHARTDFPREERRLLRRCTVGGEGPLVF